MVARSEFSYNGFLKRLTFCRTKQTVRDWIRDEPQLHDAKTISRCIYAD